jgi:hypothetical protein
MTWIYALCRKSIIDRARNALVSMPVPVPIHRDHGASLRRFLAVHRAVTFACAHLPRTDPALPVLREADRTIQAWRAAWGHGDEADVYARYDAMVRTLENQLSDCMGWTRLSAPTAA